MRARELSGTADPYAKIRLLPDRSNVWQTRIHRRTLNPVFDEDFVFEVNPESSLNDRTLEVLLYDFDAFSRHRGLGYAQFHLSTLVDILGLTLQTVRVPILRYGAEGGFRAPPLGELMVSLSYQPLAEKLTVIVVRAKNLPIPCYECIHLGRTYARWEKFQKEEVQYQAGSDESSLERYS